MTKEFLKKLLLRIKEVLKKHENKKASTTEEGHIKIGTAADTAAAGNHDHDDKYYTELEIDTKLKTKADTTIATQSADGLMSATDKTNLDNVVSSYGVGCTASGSYSHAEGIGTTASGEYSHTEGQDTKAIGNRSHAEGEFTTASGIGSHAEGYYTKAEGRNSHAEGAETTASGERSHAEGWVTTASGKASHTGGAYTTAGYEYQTVVGTYNLNKSNTLFEVGKGTGIDARSNALEVLKDGRVKVYGTPTADEDVVRKKDLATLSKSYTAGNGIAISEDGTISVTFAAYTGAFEGNGELD